MYQPTIYEPCHEKTCLRGFATRQDSNWLLDLSSVGIILSRQQTTKALIRLRECAGWSAHLLFAYGINRSSSWHGSYLWWLKECHISGKFSLRNNLCLTCLHGANDSATTSQWPWRHRLSMCTLMFYQKLGYFCLLTLKNLRNFPIYLI